MKRILFAVWALALCVLSTPAQAASKDTRFVPSRHGFRFSNTFSNDFVKALDVRTGGLCGGMVYAAADYFGKRKPIPTQDYRPANRTRLQSYIYNRQVQSIVPNVTKWGEIAANPGGARNAEFFRWGLTTELRNLKVALNKGPAPLGAKGVDGSTHQILAIGYSTGKRQSDLVIYVYDPNFPGEKLAMRPNMRGKYFSYRTRRGVTKKWRTYFVDKSYSRKTPPTVPTSNYPRDGKVRELVVNFYTGIDDLRGGRDNVNMTLHLRGGRRVVRRNINLGARWLSNYTESASVRLPAAVKKSDIQAISFETTFRGGVSGDNWDVTKIRIESYDGGKRVPLATHNRFKRFTGSRRTLRVPVVASAGTKITHLQLGIHTGGDDLRGGRDNVDATIIFRNGRRQTVRNVNGRKRWADNTTHWVDLRLSRPMERRDIVGVTLQITSRGGDNWNMDSLAAFALAGGQQKSKYYERKQRPLHRFKGDRRSFTARW